MLANLQVEEGVFADLSKFDEKNLTIIDKMILNQLDSVLAICDKAYNNFEYSTVLDNTF